MSRRPKILIYSASILACLAVFAMYLKPEFMVTVAGQIWACF